MYSPVYFIEKIKVVQISIYDKYFVLLVLRLGFALSTKMM